MGLKHPIHSLILPSLPACLVTESLSMILPSSAFQPCASISVWLYGCMFIHNASVAFHGVQRRWPLPSRSLSWRKPRGAAARSPSPPGPAAGDRPRLEPSSVLVLLGQGVVGGSCDLVSHKYTPSCHLGLLEWLNCAKMGTCKTLLLPIEIIVPEVASQWNKTTKKNNRITNKTTNLQ